MPRNYHHIKHIKQYEKEMLELKEQGLTLKEIREHFRLTREQTHQFFKRRNRNQRKISMGIILKRKGWRRRITLSVNRI